MLYPDQATLTRNRNESNLVTKFVSKCVTWARKIYNSYNYDTDMMPKNQYLDKTKWSGIYLWIFAAFGIPSISVALVPACLATIGFRSGGVRGGRHSIYYHYPTQAKSAQVLLPQPFRRA